MKETFIHLDLLDPNPYQPRQHEDPAAIQELAEQWDAEIDAVSEGSKS